MNDFTLNAEVRSDLGKGASRRLRRLADQVPAIIYGGTKAPQSISLSAKELFKLLENEAAFSQMIKLSVDGKVENVVIKAMQRHPAKGHVMHTDFIRIVAGQKLVAHVQLHFINQETSVAVKKSGAEISHTLVEVEVSCLPKDLPEFIEVDMAAIEIGEILHISDLKAPKGVEFVALAHGNDLAVANAHAPRVVNDDTDAEEEEGAAE